MIKIIIIVALKLDFCIIHNEHMLMDRENVINEYNKKIQKNESFFSSLFPSKRKEKRIGELLSDLCKLHNECAREDKESVNCLIAYEANGKQDRSIYAKRLREKYMELFSFISADREAFVEYWKKNFIPHIFIKNLLFYDTIVIDGQFNKEEAINELTGKKADKSFIKILQSTFENIKSFIFDPKRKSSILGELSRQKLFYCADKEGIILMDKSSSKTVGGLLKERGVFPSKITCFIPGIAPEVQLLNCLEYTAGNGVVIASVGDINNQVGIFNKDTLKKNGEHLYDVFRCFVNGMKNSGNVANILNIQTMCKGMYSASGFFKKFNYDHKMQKYFKGFICDYNIPMAMQDNNEMMKNIANIVFNNDNQMLFDFRTTKESFDILHTFSSLRTDVCAFFQEYMNLLEKEADNEKRLEAIIRIQDLSVFNLFTLTEGRVSIGCDLEAKKNALLKQLEGENKDIVDGGVFDFQNKYIDLAKDLQQQLNAFIEKNNLSADIRRKREELKQAKQQNTNLIVNNKAKNIVNNIKQNEMMSINNNSNQNNILNLTNTQNNVATVSQ